jgi:hypothetical protein
MSKVPMLLASMMALVTTGLIACGATTTAAPSVSGEASSASMAATTGSGSGGLVAAMHAQCDVGEKVLRYLATDDNGGDAQLDVLLSKYVGVPLPQARAIADQQIQQCDANVSGHEAAQASASASAKAQASRAAAETQASAQAAQDKAARVAAEQKACAPLGGQVRDGGSFADLCVSTKQGSTTDGSRTSCAFAQIPFQPDGTLSSSDIDGFKDGYPGCFA